MTDGTVHVLALEPHVVAAARGDREAFAHLVEATSGVVCAIALAIVRDVETSRDVAQDVFLAAWRDLKKLRNPASFLPWLRQLTRNRAHHVLRGEVRRRRRQVDDRTDALLAAAADPHPSAVDRLVVEEERAALERALDELPDAAREVVVLYYREGCSVRQVADLLGLSEAAVKQRLARARAQVRDALLERAGGALRATAPGAAFTATVMLALSLAAPSTAAAAGLGLGKLAAGSKLAGQLGTVGAGVSAGAAAGALSGLLGGWMGVLGGARRMLARARDDRERRGIRIYTAVCMLVVTAFAALLFLVPRKEPATAGFAAMMAVFWVLHFWWLPRVTRRRRAAELSENPGMAAIHARERRHARLGFALGTILGGAPLVVAWWLGW